MPGYQVEWKSKGSATHQYAAIKKNIAKPQFQYVPFLGSNNVEQPTAKPLAAEVVNKPNEHKNAIAGSCKLAVLKFVQPEVKADTGKQALSRNKVQGTRLAIVGLNIAAIALAMVVLVIVLALMGASEVISLGTIGIYVLVIAGIAGIILGLVALIVGINALERIANDPNLKAEHGKAVASVVIGAVIIAVVFLPILGLLIAAGLNI